MPNCPGLILREAVVTAILGAGIDGLTTAAAVKARDKPERLTSDPDKMCVVVLRADLPAADRRDNMQVRFDWPILVVLFRKQLSGVVQSDGWRDEARFVLRKLLWRHRFADNVEWCQYESEPLFDGEAVPANIDRSGQMFTYRYVEPSQE